MGNLGRYEEITAQAKQAGGVDAWISALEAAAADQSSAAFAKGIAVGLVVAGAIGAGARIGWNIWTEQRARRTAAAKAATRLRTCSESPQPQTTAGGPNHEDADEGRDEPNPVT